MGRWWLIPRFIWIPLQILSWLMEGLKLALSKGCMRIEVFSDSQMAVKFITKKAVVWNKVEMLMEDIWSLMISFNDVNFYYAPRSCNKVADFLAKNVCGERR